MSKQKDVITIDQINEDGTYTEVFQYRRSLRNCFRAFARILPGTSVSWVTIRPLAVFSHRDADQRHSIYSD